MTYEIYTDKDLDIEIHYTLFPSDTVYKPEIEMKDIHINGAAIHINLESMLFERYGESWENEILKEVQK